MDKCMNCGKPLSNDEIGLHKRLINRGDTEFMCKECLSAHFKVPIGMLDRIVNHYKAQGCMLFE